MPSDLEGSDLERRATAIRLPIATLAKKAGVNKHTVHRMFGGDRGSYAANVRAVEGALAAEERALLAHLVGLYPTHALLLASDGPRREAAE